MPRRIDFEERPYNYDWPEPLKGLHYAATAAAEAFAHLDDTVEDGDEDRGPLLALAGAQWTTLQAIRTEGEIMLAAWESEQQLVKGEIDGELRVSHHEGDTHPYGVERLYYGQWCPVMSPYDPEKDLRFMSQGEAEAWIADR